MDKLRVVFDCMIFLQAATRSTGPAAALLELAEIGELELLVADACLEEIRDVLTRPSIQRKFPSLTTSTVGEFIERIHVCSVLETNVPSVFVLDRDPKDAKYIDLVIAAKADVLVTRDKDLLDLREPDSPLSPVFEKMNWQCKILDPFEMLSYLRNR